MFHCKPEDGKISWLRNPGATGNGDGAEWKTCQVAGLMATYRLRFGHFTRTDRLQLLALPVVGPRGGIEAVHEPVRIMLYAVPDDPETGPWEGTVVDDANFRIIRLPARRECAACTSTAGTGSAKCSVPANRPRSG